MRAAIEIVSDELEHFNLLHVYSQYLLEKGKTDECEQVLLRAISHARQMKNHHHRSRAFVRLIKIFVQQQQIEKAELLAKEIDSSYDKAEALASIAVSLVLDQQWERAEKMIRQIQEPIPLVDALSKLAVALMQIQQPEKANTLFVEAEKVAQRIDHILYRELSLITVANALKQVGQWERVEMVARQIERSDSSNYPTSLLVIVRAFLQARWWERAEEVAREIEESIYRVYAFDELAYAFWQDCQWEKALSAIEIAKASARRISYEYENTGLIRVAQMLNNMHQWEQAEALFGEIANPAEWEIAELAMVLVKKADLFMCDEQRARASEVLVQAEEFAQKIEKSSQRVQVLSAIAIALWNNQQWEQAEIMLAKAEVAACKGKESQILTLGSLVKVLVYSQQWERAEIVAQQVIDPNERTYILQDLFLSLWQAQEWTRAESVLTQAEAAARDPLADSVQVPCMLSKIAQLWRQVQRWEQAEEAVQGINLYYMGDETREVLKTLAQSQQWERFVILARTIESPFDRASIMSEIAQEIIPMQQSERALMLLADAEEAAFKIEGLEHQTVKILSSIALSLWQLGQWERAMSILVAAENASKRKKANVHDTQILQEVINVLVSIQKWEREKSPMSEDMASHVRDIVLAHREQQWERFEKIILAEEKEVVRELSLKDLAIALSEVQRWEQAEKLVAALSTPSNQAFVLGWIAHKLIQEQQWCRAEDFLSCAENIVQNRASDYSGTLAWLARIYAQGRHWEKVENIIKLIKRNKSKNSDFKSIVEYLVQDQCWDKAEELTFSIDEETYDRKEAVKILAKALGEAQQWSRLIALLQRIWLLAETREQAFCMPDPLYELVKQYPWLGVQFYNVFVTEKSWLAHQ
ncbi:hypothetical protein KTT_22390 [Tengunoibacter tsumagoiensis]|uniref:MalT-like TPR region domain-containing protein n=1 Tax=Tengunoibacter tsumagoiensis TaxID=2014871 RepID=A0A401ZZS0_9CHLR|nr:hypothetical protein KTT_22390 [Tengunoibacter tsumagoiensis]